MLRVRPRSLGTVAEVGCDAVEEVASVAARCATLDARFSSPKIGSWWKRRSRRRRKLYFSFIVRVVSCFGRRIHGARVVVRVEM
jgi:hypothetical protein